MVAFYESVKSAQQVTVDEIPLPQVPQQMTSNIPSQIPLPTEVRKPEHTIYSIATALKLQALVSIQVSTFFDSMKLKQISLLTAGECALFI